MNKHWSEINRSWITLHSLNISGGLQNLMDQRRRTIEEWILRRKEAWRFQEELLVSTCEWPSHQTQPKISYCKDYSVPLYKIQVYTYIYKKIYGCISIFHILKIAIQEKKKYIIKNLRESRTKWRQIYCNITVNVHDDVLVCFDLMG